MHAGLSASRCRQSRHRQGVVSPWPAQAGPPPDLPRWSIALRMVGVARPTRFPMRTAYRPQALRRPSRREHHRPATGPPSPCDMPRPWRRRPYGAPYPDLPPLARPRTRRHRRRSARPRWSFHLEARRSYRRLPWPRRGFSCWRSGARHKVSISRRLCAWTGRSVSRHCGNSG